MDQFTQAYIECALWSSTNDAGEPLDGLGLDLAPETQLQLEADCQGFQSSNAELLAKWYAECGESEDRAGHDFWLTRNRHGAGYWDRWNGGTPQGKIGALLTDAAHAYGECDLYVGDNNNVYAS
jgi:hypothetical protein